MANLSISAVSAAGSTYDLTALGSLDWLDYSDTGPTLTRKASANLITLAITGGAAVVGFSNGGAKFNWTDGTSPASGSLKDTGGYIGSATATQGWSFTLPADTTARRFRLYAGIFQGAGLKVTATLSDGSAPAVSDSSNTYSSGAATVDEYTVDYQAAAAGQTLTVTVLPVNGGTTNVQAAALGTPPAPVAPGAPTIGTITSGNASISVPFTAPASQGSSPITSYTVSVYNTSNALVTSANGTSSPIIVSGLANGTAVYAKVAATNGAGTGAQSAASNTVTPNNVNNPPIESGTISNITGQAGVAITPVDVHGYFSDTDALTYSASPAGTAWPSGLTINSSTGVISGTVAAAGTTTGIKVRATDTASQTADSNAFNVVISAGPQQVPYNDPAITFSPYTWDDRGTAKSANTPGAYAKMTFSGTSVTAKFDVSALSGASVAAGSYPIVRMVVDGKYATDIQLASGSPNAAVTGLAAGTHTIEMYFRAVDVNLANRWGAAAGAQPVPALLFQGFTLDAGATYGAIAPRGKNLAFWGDSITEGYIVNAAANPGGNNAQGTVVPFLAQALGAEYGQLGYSAQGYEQGGNGGVPALYNATPANSPVNFYSNGRSRLVSGVLSPAPDYICVMHGANGTPTSTGVGGVIDQLRTIAPSARIFILVPAGGYARSAITTAVNARSGDTKLTLIDLGADYQPGMDNSGNGGQYSNDSGLHPNLLGNAKAAAGYTSKIQSAIDGAVALATSARTFATRLYLDASTPAASLTGLKIRCYNVDGTLAYSTDTGTSDASGNVSVVAQSTAAAGASCLMTVRNVDHHWSNFVTVT